jgi:hypothetical protein
MERCRHGCRALLVVLLPAEWAHTLARPQKPCKRAYYHLDRYVWAGRDHHWRSLPLEARDARQVEHVRAAQYDLLSYPEGLAADRARVLCVAPRFRLLLTVLPFIAGESGWGTRDLQQSKNCQNLLVALYLRRPETHQPSLLGKSESRPKLLSALSSAGRASVRVPPTCTRVWPLIVLEGARFTDPHAAVLNAHHSPRTYAVAAVSLQVKRPTSSAE